MAQVNIQPAGSGTVTQVLNANIITLTAIPSAGYRFDRWVDVWPDKHNPGQMTSETSYANPYQDATTPADVYTAYFVQTGESQPDPGQPQPQPQEMNTGALLAIGAAAVVLYELLKSRK